MRKHYDFSNAKKNPYAARLKRQDASRSTGAKSPKKSTGTRRSSRAIDRELKALERMKDEDIDLSDIPEITDWSGAVRGKFYRPSSETVTVSSRFQVVIPRALRESMRIRPGQKVQMVLYMDRIELIPLKPLT
jgi:AbrB family looped-hinge helix DNA binding protein